MSSIESLDFSVTCEEDVEIVVKDIDGWKLGSSCPMVLCTQFFVFSELLYSIQHGALPVSSFIYNCNSHCTFLVCLFRESPY